jgi:hypothetical protein
MILAGYHSRNVDILDEKRDKQALGLALVTVPISIVGALGGADAASAQYFHRQRSCITRSKQAILFRQSPESFNFPPTNL